MSKKPVSWMWLDETTDKMAVSGLRLDTDKGLLHWTAEIGCHCDEADAIQTIADYKKTGVPGFIAIPPDDVLAEIAQVIGGGKVED
ncbi:MAG: hypothetical protein Kow0080_00920 [Candidatus Promineifilaceae bacterium]